MAQLIATLRSGHGAVIYGNVMRTTFGKFFEIQCDADAGEIEEKSSSITSNFTASFSNIRTTNFSSESGNIVKIHSPGKEIQPTKSTYSITELRKGYWSLPNDDKTQQAFGYSNF
eukprot:TRINITY_DN2819_c0_g1_i1.p2 TRINITY_DN2819_c0_g1~~TRINITY_DN2819_c0_g1_i1.p2  ORF type:complete len:115 (+),score=19.12 TRINITY_DN2819_c0_g1_i1:168-512(+)